MSVLKHLGLLSATVLALGLAVAACSAPRGHVNGRHGAEPVQIRGTVKTNGETSWLSIAAEAAEIAVGIAALFGLPAIAYQVSAARRNAISERTADVQLQWGSKEFLHELSPVIAYLRVHGDIDDCLEKVRAWETTSSAEVRALPRTPRSADAPAASPLDVLHVLLFYEDLCQRYNRNEIDRELVASSIGLELLTRFTEGCWYIHWQRATDPDDLLYYEWEKTLIDLRRERRRRWLRADSHPVYSRLRETECKFLPRAICVPPNPTKASDASWTRAARLSKALALPTAIPDGLTSGYPVNQKRRSKPEWKVVLVPERLGEPRARRAWDRGLAVAIERCLDGMDNDAIDTAIANLVGLRPITRALRIEMPAVESRMQRVKRWLRST
jgi:hypothetical protein